MPRVGGPVSIHHLGCTVLGVVHAVDVEGRRVEVETEDGCLESFALNRATATFTADGSQTGARLRFVPEA
jgi:hypothetical protein